jgi:hypothetical protein
MPRRNKSSRNSSRDLGTHEDVSLSEKREEVSFCDIQGGIRGRWKWIMDYEIAFDGAMRPEVRESHAGQRLGEKVSSWHGLGLGRIRVTQIVQLEFCEINECKEVEKGMLLR